MARAVSFCVPSRAYAHEEATRLRQLGYRPVRIVKNRLGEFCVRHGALAPPWKLKQPWTRLGGARRRKKTRK